MSYEVKLFLILALALITVALKVKRASGANKAAGIKLHEINLQTQIYEPEVEKNAVDI